jgi:hypothetical protein
MPLPVFSIRDGNGSGRIKIDLTGALKAEHGGPGWIDFGYLPLGVEGQVTDWRRLIKIPETIKGFFQFNLGIP